jgi:hypothetical protein
MDPPTKIDVGDSQALKKTIDDAVGDVLFSDAHGFSEYMGWSNRRLLLMTAAAAAGFTAQFAPIPLPQGRWILGGLVTLFFILYFALQYLTMFVDKDYIIMTKVRVSCDTSWLSFSVLSSCVGRGHPVFTFAVRIENRSIRVWGYQR